MADMPESLAVSVVVPVKNEAENILPLVTEIDAALRETGAAYEIVYVDDGSDDETPARLRATQVAFPALRILTHSNSCGQSRAVHTGVKHARGRMIVTLDGDGQNVPADIPGMWARLDGSHDLMVAGRRTTRQDVWIKRVSSRWANRIRARLLQDDTPDTGCGLKLFPRDAFLELPYFNHMHRFLPALMQRHGYRVVNHDVKHRGREHGTSKYGTLDRLFVSIFDIAGVAWLQRRMSQPQKITDSLRTQTGEDSLQADQ